MIVSRVPADSSEDFDSVLITGGTGTFGTTYLLQAIENGWHKRITLYSRDEFKQMRLLRYVISRFKETVIEQSGCGVDVKTPIGITSVRFFIGDVCDPDRIAAVINGNGVDAIIHAAALKHVAVCEYSPLQAINVNVTGTTNVVRAAADASVRKMVSLSTDKAVDPINMYGATKLCLEKITLGMNAYTWPKTAFCVVRYGNVIGSRGSVIDLLSDQSREVAITDPNSTRFWLTVEEAIDLVRIALIEGVKGEIFVPKMKSMVMRDVFSCFRPDASARSIGMHLGEKEHETMVSKHELLRTYDVGSCYVVAPSVSFSDKLCRKLKGKLVTFSSYTSDSVERMTNAEFLEKVSRTAVRENNEASR